MNSNRPLTASSAKQRWLALPVASVLLIGCGDISEEPLRTSVSGTVALDGTPLKEGTVVFVPTNGTAGPRVAIAVTNGHFEANAEHGPMIGQHRVEIQSTCGPAFDDEQMMDRLAADPQRLKVVIVPPIYNASSQLTATIQHGSQNDLTFDLKMPRRRR